MRIPIPASTQARQRPTRISHLQRKRNAKLQLFDPVTLFIANKEQDLLSLDAVGNPQRGFKVTGPMAAPMDFLAIDGLKEIWVTCNQQTEIEYEEWPI